MLNKFYHLNRMGRIEGPPLAGILLLAGCVLASQEINQSVWIASFFMVAICMNYVYLVNGVTDIEEDSINSPNRPLAAGVISLELATKYVWLLFGLTVIYPFFVHDKWIEIVMVWAILLMGYFYSNPPVRFKRFPPLATLYLVVNFNLPLIIGYNMTTESFQLPPFLLSTLFLFLSNMPLKDYGDRDGDEQAGVMNWVKLAGGTSQLLFLSSTISIIGAVCCYFLLPTIAYREMFILLPLLPFLNIIFHKVLSLNMDEMFTRGVRSLIVLGGIFIVLNI